MIVILSFTQLWWWLAVAILALDQTPAHFTYRTVSGLVCTLSLPAMSLPAPEVVGEWNADDGVPLTTVMAWAGITDDNDQQLIAELLGATGEEPYYDFAHMTSAEEDMVISAERDGSVLVLVLVASRVKRCVFSNHTRQGWRLG